MPNIDRAVLLAWVRARADHPSVLVHAAYTGLADRIEHGQFDTPGTPETRGGITPVGLDSGTQKKTGPGSASTLNPDPRTAHQLSKQEVAP